MKSFVQHIKTLTDGTMRLLLRLEGGELEEPIVLSGSLFNGDLIIVEKIERAPETAEIPVPIVEESPGLLSA